MEMKKKNEKRGNAVSCPQAPVLNLRTFSDVFFNDRLYNTYFYQIQIQNCIVIKHYSL
jgi:hypothetical protein